MVDVPPSSSLTRPAGSTHLTFTMAAMTALGGVAGFAQARSARSLIGGVLFGAAFGWAGYTVQQGDGEKGFRLATIASTGLAAVMGQRFYKTRKPMPAGLLAGLGVASGLYHAAKWREWAE